MKFFDPYRQMDEKLDFLWRVGVLMPGPESTDGRCTPEPLSWLLALSRRGSMSRRIHRHGRRTGLVLAATVGLACCASGVAQASTVDLGTVKSFVVVAGSTVTNTGPSVLNGDLGVFPGTA